MNLVAFKIKLILNMTVFTVSDNNCLFLFFSSFFYFFESLELHSNMLYAQISAIFLRQNNKTIGIITSIYLTDIYIVFDVIKKALA